MLNIAKTIYAGWDSSRKYELPEADLIPDGDSINEKKKLEKLTKQYTVIMEYDNIPLPGFTLYRSNKKNWGSLDSTWLVIDPRGFLSRISSKNLQEIMHCTGITEGLIQQKCVWARDNSSTILSLVPISSLNYQELIENTDLIDSKVDMKDVQLGDKVLLQNKTTGIYMGKVSLYGIIDDYRFTKEFKAASYLRREVIKLDSGQYYYQTDLKILKVLIKTTTPYTREESLAMMNKDISIAECFSINVLPIMLYKTRCKIKLVSATAITNIPLDFIEINIDDARPLYKMGHNDNDCGLLMLEDHVGNQYTIDFPFTYTSSMLTSIPANHTFNISKIDTFIKNSKGQVEKIVLTEKRKSHWTQGGPIGTHSLSDFKKYYKIVKNIKKENYI